MSNNSLFNSTEQSIPGLRPDLEVVPYRQNGESYLVFRDMLGYVPDGFGLRRQTESLLSLIDGSKSVKDLAAYLNGEGNPGQLLEFVQLLDKNNLLNSPHFKNYAEGTEQKYEQSTLHHSVTAGSSYPADPEELRSYLDEAFTNIDEPPAKPASDIKALYAPHIDPRVGIESYAKAFAPLRHIKPKRVIILATSHYAGLYPNIYQDTPFILVDKDFDMPLGSIKRDQHGIELLSKNNAKPSKGISGHDRAHRIEHSIELHLLFLSYLWKHDFCVIPILISSLDELYYKKDGHLGGQVQNFSELLSRNFGRDEDTFFLISGDLAHFGKKFGDKNPAASMFDDVQAFDKQFLDHAAANSPGKMLKLMEQECDPYRICGFPPLYTFLKAMPNLKGKQLSYDLWDEQERESAVTFGSILFSG